ncbi:MAG: hypothetical protein P8M30_08175 [Planctomycetaceae bacterium]|nr:hypothetical protein [Planctomycetaceae bacterium]MDC0307703.1 hypothetical protein [Planctomycetaceae bacterium]MDG2389283.1 hypothetical protein [Planctomycetaceae bacterium]
MIDSFTIPDRKTNESGSHRKLATPFRMFRRKLLVILGVRKNQGYVDSEHFPEAAVRLRHQNADTNPRKAA